jgi:hypothetical protein
VVWYTGFGVVRVHARRSGAVVIALALALTVVLVWLGCAALEAPPASAP